MLKVQVILTDNSNATVTVTVDELGTYISALDDVVDNLFVKIH